MEPGWGRVTLSNSRVRHSGEKNCSRHTGEFFCQGHHTGEKYLKERQV